MNNTPQNEQDSSVTIPVERVQTGVRIERRLLKVLKALAEYFDITLGDLLEGITSDGMLATTETLLIRGKSRTIRRIHSTHYLQRKDPQIQKIIF